MPLKHFITSTVALSFLSAAHGADVFTVPGGAKAALQQHCISCHGPKKQKGKVRLDTLAALSPKARAELLNKIQEQLHFDEMPPEEEKRPTAAQKKALNDWVGASLAKAGGSKLQDKLRYPDYGNYVDHNKLFSGNIKDKAYTPARRWLVSPQIFHQRVIDVFRLEGRDRAHYLARDFYGVTNPFKLTERSGVRDYDNTTLDGGHLLVMLTNADWISRKQIFAAQQKGVDRKKIQFANPKDRWYPKTHVAFEKIIQGKARPTDAQIADAIHAQFDCVLRRRATPAELTRYMDLTKSSIAVGGNVEGLRKMLVAVLLESEFLYRLEFGGGKADAHGRKKLTPREAAYAISYAGRSRPGCRAG